MKNRDLNALEAEFSLKVKKFFEFERIKELWVVFDEWLRTTERQQELYAQWRTTPWTIVTWLDWVDSKSIHQLWKAFDIFFLENWAATWTKPYEIWREVADIAKQCGMDWGYDLWGWDKPHFQDDWTIPDLENLETYILTMTDKDQKIIAEIVAKNSREWHECESAEAKALLSQVNVILKNGLNNL